MSSSIKIGNKKKYILTLGMGPIQGLEHTLSPEKMYSINFTENNKKFRLSLLYNGAICFFILICLLLYLLFVTNLERHCHAIFKAFNISNDLWKLYA